MDPEVTKLFQDFAKALRQKSVHYVVAVMDADDRVFYKYDSKVATKGIIDMIAQDIKEEWKESRPGGGQG